MNMCPHALLIFHILHVCKTLELMRISIILYEKLFVALFNKTQGERFEIDSPQLFQNRSLWNLVYALKVQLLSFHQQFSCIEKKLFVCKALCKTKLQYSQTAEHFFKMQFLRYSESFIKTVRSMAPESGVKARGGQSGHIVKYNISQKIFYPTPVFI